MITTGGNRPGDRFTEAQASTAYLVDQGVPESAVVEVGGATSFESLELVRDQIRFRGLRSIRFWSATRTTRCGSACPPRNWA
ncbi:MAG: hypothetical protein R2694_02490 [Ilumatobacteraceae bacterium]